MIWVDGSSECRREYHPENELNDGVVRSYANILRRWNEIKQPRRILGTNPLEFSRPQHGRIRGYHHCQPSQR